MRERLPPSSEPPWFCTHSPPGMPKTRAYQPPRAPTPAFLVPNTLFVSVRHDDAGEGGKGRASSPAATRWSPPPPPPLSLSLRQKEWGSQQRVSLSRPRFH